MKWSSFEKSVIKRKLIFKNFSSDSFLVNRKLVEYERFGLVAEVEEKCFVFSFLLLKKIERNRKKKQHCKLNNIDKLQQFVVVTASNFNAVVMRKKSMLS